MTVTIFLGALLGPMALGVPIVYARKTKPITMFGPVFLETAPSHTKGTEVNLLVAAEFMPPNQDVLIVDDFLATGKTLRALVRIVEGAQSRVAGVGVVVEKTFEGGRDYMRQKGYTMPIEALAVITSMDDGKIIFADEKLHER